MAVWGCCLFLLAAQMAPAASAESSWWPWHHKNTTTTTPAPSHAAHDFEEGLVAGLGLHSVGACFEKSTSSVEDLYEAERLYHKGGMMNKARALKDFAEFTKNVVEALRGCSSAMSEGEQYRRLVKALTDRRFYSLSNALTLGLNLAEDREMLTTFAHAFEEKHYYAAGLELMQTILDVLEHPGIPDQGKPAVLFGQGLAEGFGTDLDVKCFDDAVVELSEISGGVMSLVSVIHVVGGLESLFHGLMGIVPLFKDCIADAHKMKELFHLAEDFKHPAELAKALGHNIIENGVDISLEVASALLDVKDQCWQRLGEDVGKILAKVVVSSQPPSLVV